MKKLWKVGAAMWRHSLLSCTKLSSAKQSNKESINHWTLHYFSLSVSILLFSMVWLSYHSACNAISAILRGRSFSLPPALSVSSTLDCFVDYNVSAQQCKLACWKHSLLFISILLRLDCCVLSLPEMAWKRNELILVTFFGCVFALEVFLFLLLPVLILWQTDRALKKRVMN